MKTWHKILLIFVATFIVIQFFPTMENNSDVVPATDLIQARPVPSRVATLLHNACYDCHSNNTNYPWYNKIQPVAWFLEDDIKTAKSHLNFNKFETYSRKKQKEKLKHMRSAMKKDLMPLTSYKLLHAEARLTQSEREAIIDWVDKALQSYE